MLSITTTLTGLNSITLDRWNQMRLPTGSQPAEEFATLVKLYANDDPVKVKQIDPAKRLAFIHFGVGDTEGVMWVPVIFLEGVSLGMDENDDPQVTIDIPLYPVSD